MNRFYQSVSERFEKRIFLNSYKIVFENHVKKNILKILQTFEGFKKGFYKTILKTVQENTFLKPF